MRGEACQAREGAMKYMLLIHQGDSPTPASQETWATLAVYGLEGRLAELGTPPYAPDP
ncbi:MAG TPA: hypothetical protein VE522_06385 [Actinomycetota bacterium]|nr:hypothetical protein [Actinomycetota bacterium]